MKSFRENRGHKDKLTVPAGFLGNGLAQPGYTQLVFEPFRECTLDGLRALCGWF